MYVYIAWQALSHTTQWKNRQREYLDEQSVQQVFGDTGDVGCDHFEVEKLKKLAHLDHGVSLFVAGDAHNHRFLAHFIHSELRATPPETIKFHRQD